MPSAVNAVVNFDANVKGYVRGTKSGENSTKKFRGSVEQLKKSSTGLGKETTDLANKTQRWVRATNSSVAAQQRLLIVNQKLRASITAQSAVMGGLIARHLRFTAVLGILGGTAGIGALARKYGAYGDEILNFRDQTGLTIAEIENLIRVFSRVNIDANSTRNTFVKLNESVTKAAEGNIEAAREFETLGVSIRNANGDLKSVSQIFSELADGANARGIERSTKALRALLGRSGANLFPIFGQLKEYLSIASEVGNTTDAQANALSRLHNEFERLGFILQQSFRSGIGDNADRYREIIERLNEEIPELVAGFLKLTAAALENKEELGRLAGALVGLAIGKHFGIIGAAAGALSGYFITDLIPAIGKAIDEFNKLFGAIKRNDEVIQSSIKKRGLFVDDVPIIGPGDVETPIAKTAVETTAIAPSILPQVKALPVATSTATSSGSSSNVVDFVQQLKNEAAEKKGLQDLLREFREEQAAARTLEIETLNVDRGTDAATTEALERQIELYKRKIDLQGVEGVNLELANAQYEFQHAISERINSLEEQKQVAIINKKAALAEYLQLEIDSLQIGSEKYDQLVSQNNALKDLIKTNNELTESSKKQADRLVKLKAIGMEFGEAFKDSFKGIVKGTQTASEAFKAFGERILDTILDVVLDQFVQQFITTILGGGSGSGLISLLGFASGGQIAPGFAVVGEQGPEILQTNRPGRIYSNDKLSNVLSGTGKGGNVINITNNISSNRPQEVAEVVSTLLPKIIETALGAFETAVSNPSGVQSAVVRAANGG